MKFSVIIGQIYDTQQLIPDTDDQIDITNCLELDDFQLSTNQNETLC